MGRTPPSPIEVAEAFARTKARAGELELIIEGVEQDWLGSDSSSLAMFIPVRLVSCIEVAVRSALGEVVDHGGEYFERGVELLKKGGVKELIETWVAINSDHVSIGALVSRSQRTGSVNDIVGALTSVYGDSFTVDLANAQNRVEVELNGLPSQPIIRDLNNTLASIDRMLQVRHIIAHEAPVTPPFDPGEVDRFFRVTRDFVSALWWTIATRLHGAFPLTQKDMNELAEKGLEAAQLELAAALELARAKGGGKELEQAQALWSEFAEYDAQWRAGYLSGEHPGTIAPMLYANHKAHLTASRAKDLTERYGQDHLDVVDQESAD